VKSSSKISRNNLSANSRLLSSQNYNSERRT